MMKHLFWYPWIMAALAAGILDCAGLIPHMLFFQAPPEAYHPGAQLVQEVFFHALA